MKLIKRHNSLIILSLEPTFLNYTTLLEKKYSPNRSSACSHPPASYPPLVLLNLSTFTPAPTTTF
ncbi:histone-arginine methyltransferase CARM1 [Cryptococcus neoformans]|nr:histone-arginine methyltransferase CARM1 [Cryptococcus neoformans var. grubii]